MDNASKVTLYSSVLMPSSERAAAIDRMCYLKRRINHRKSKLHFSLAESLIDYTDYYLSLQTHGAVLISCLGVQLLLSILSLVYYYSTEKQFYASPASNEIPLPSVGTFLWCSSAFTYALIVTEFFIGSLAPKFFGRLVYNWPRQVCYTIFAIQNAILITAVILFTYMGIYYEDYMHQCAVNFGVSASQCGSNDVGNIDASPFKSRFEDLYQPLTAFFKNMIRSVLIMMVGYLPVNYYLSLKIWNLMHMFGDKVEEKKT